MRTFMGTYLHSLDSKGRLTVPSRFRELMPDGATLTEGVEQCLDLYPGEVWQQKANRVVALDDFTPEGRNARRKLFANAEPAEFDRQGRVILSQSLRQSAGIEKDVAVVGAGEKIEIWSQESWEQQKRRVDESAADTMLEARSQSTHTL
tara:strand:- start:202 stop:648 length:447 start_codon:yes stop_codon:yes gene_type:complete